MNARLERPRWWQWLPILIIVAAARSGGQSHNGGGPLSLMVALPLTELSHENLNTVDLTPSPRLVLNPIGFYQLAAAQLALDLFNARNKNNTSIIVIPELTSLMEGCDNITMDKFHVVDTHLNNTLDINDDDNATTMSLTDMNAIVGPYYEIPALEWTIQATQAGIPLVSHLIAHNNHNLQLHDHYQRYPSFTQISVTAQEEMTFVVEYLQHVQRTTYIAVLFPNRPSSIHQVKILWQLLEAHAITNVRLFVYQPPIHGESEQQTCGPPEHEIPTVVEAIRRSGFRTIVLLGAMPQDVPLLSAAATANSLDTGHYLWVLSSSPELVAQTTTIAAPFLNGAAYLTPDEYQLHEHVMTKLQRDEAFRARVVAQAWSPLSAFLENKDSVYTPTVDSRPSYVPGMGFLFDAVLSVGLGACRRREQLQQQHQQQLSSEPEYNLQDGIRRVEFEGASGHVRFGGASTRPGHTVPFTVLNLLRGSNGTMLAQQSETFDPRTKEWKQLQPFEYGHGSTEPPALLRTIPNQNYISAGARVFGMTLFGISMATVTACAIWVWRHCNESIVLASQPVFLYTICFASGLSGLTILIAAFDESWGLEASALTGMCFCWTWLDAMGTTIIYSALFTKLWRTSRALQQPNDALSDHKSINGSTSNNIALWSVAWPFCLFLLAAIAIMVAMTIYSDYGWVRVVVDEESGESQGFCDGSDTLMYLFPLHTVHMIPICLSAFLALQTKEFGDTYDESKWILTLLAVQCMVMMTSVPTIFLLDEISPTASYLGLAGFWFTIPVSCMGLLIVPKVVAVRRIKLLAAAAAEDPYRQSTETTMPSVNPSTGDQDSNDGQGSDVWLSEQSPITTDGPRIQIVTFD